MGPIKMMSLFVVLFHLRQISMRTLRDFWSIGNKFAVTESILTSHLSMDEISSLLEEKCECPRFPAHTQVEERLIREITRACGSVAVCKCRDGFIRARIASRKVVPKANAKLDIVAMAKV